MRLSVYAILALFVLGALIGAPGLPKATMTAEAAFGNFAFSVLETSGSFAASENKYDLAHGSGDCWWAA